MEEPKQSARSVEIDTQHLKLACHENARNAWLCWKELHRQFDPKILSPALWEITSSTILLHAIKNKQHDYKFFCGFPIVYLINADLTPTVTIREYKNIKPDQIEKLAWGDLLSTLLFSLNNETGLGSTYQAINSYMPIEMKRILFGRKNLSRAVLASSAKVTSEVLRWQENKILEKTNTAPSMTILSQILHVKND